MHKLFLYLFLTITTILNGQPSNQWLQFSESDEEGVLEQVYYHRSDPVIINDQKSSQVLAIVRYVPGNLGEIGEMTIIFLLNNDGDLSRVKIIPTDTIDVPIPITVGCVGAEDGELKTYTCAYTKDGDVVCLTDLTERILSGEELTIYLNSYGDASWQAHLTAKTRISFGVTPFES